VMRFEVVLRDVPGALARLADVAGKHYANILHIIHERTAKDVPIGFSKVILILETRDRSHIRQIKKGLQEQNYSIKILA